MLIVFYVCTIFLEKKHNSAALNKIKNERLKRKKVFLLRSASHPARFAPHTPTFPGAPARTGIGRLGNRNIPSPTISPLLVAFVPVELNPTAMAAFLPALLLLAVVSPSAGAAPDAALVVSRIAFGSCANQSAPQVLDRTPGSAPFCPRFPGDTFGLHFSLQPIWDAVAGFNPQVFIWLGDNVYGDNKRPFRVLGRERTVGPWKNVPRFYPSTEEELRQKYELAKAQPGYAKLREKAQVSSRQALFWSFVAALIASSSSIARCCFHCKL
jgi:hypothetical protein